MPCGGIYPMGRDGVAVTHEKHNCWECNKPKPDCALIEWDAYIHSACVPAFLETEEGKVVLNHGHEVSIWKDGKVLTLHEEK